MTITVNSKPHTFESEKTISELISDLGLQGKPVLIEQNKKALVASAFPKTSISDGDVIEVLVLGAGG